MLKRNRNKQTTTLEHRLREFAENARSEARRAPAGRDHALIRKAQKAEAIGGASERLHYADAVVETSE